ncbi:hypothetical protein ACCS91_39560, partial [Rhizobium ruizarguesonis]
LTWLPPPTRVEPWVSTFPLVLKGRRDMPQHLDSLFSPRGEGARRADEGGQGNRSFLKHHAGFDYVGAISIGFKTQPFDT